MEIKNTLNPLDPYTQTKLNNTTQTGQAVARKTPEAAAPKTEAGDRISLSPEAKLRTEAFSTATNAADVRADKVAAIRSRVESGEYQIDSKAIAAKLLQEEPGLFQP